MIPRVSVIVPAHNAAATLPATLAALDRQTFDGPFEVIVVDDASIDGTSGCGEGSARKLVRLTANVGPADARNAGIDAAQAELLAFTDADCEPDPGWLTALVAALETHDLVQGPVVPVRDPGPFDRTLSLPGPSPRFETANLGVRTELAKRIRFRTPDFVTAHHFGEDALFGHAALRAGATATFAPDAVVRHAVFPRGPRGYLQERKRLELFPHLVKAVPELRETGVFLNRRTALFDLAVAGIVTAALTRRKAPLLAALPYVRERVYLPRQLYRRSVARVNLAYVAGDAIGALALAKGSYRARSLLL